MPALRPVAVREGRVEVGEAMVVIAVSRGKKGSSSIIKR